jgi:hypothetical protein
VRPVARVGGKVQRHRPGGASAAVAARLVVAVRQAAVRQAAVRQGEAVGPEARYSYL